jgi:capsid assembly protease
MNVLDILNSPWAIAPEKLNEICAIYAAHRDRETRDLQALEKLVESKAYTGAASGAGSSSGRKNYTVEDGVALISIEGVLSKRISMFQQICGGMSYTSLQQDLAAALADPNVKSIILTIDSPGGTVDGVQAASDAIFAARSQKPICAYVDGLAASAAYWLGSAASEVYIGSDTDTVGSIGIVTQHLDTSMAEHQRGVKITDIAAGRYKTVGSQHAPLSAQDRSTIQDQLDHMYSIFVDTVARNRGTDAETALSKMADGRVFIGQKAIDAGLVDGKMTLMQLMQKMSARTGGMGVRRNATNRVTDGTKPVPGSTTTELPLAQSESSENPKPTPVPLSKAELKIAKLKVLKAEETATRRLLRDTESAHKTAKVALHQAIRPGAKMEDLLPYTTSEIRAGQTVRELRERLRQNDYEQLEVLRG